MRGVCFLVVSRSDSNRVGGYSLHAQHDTRKVSAPGRAAAAEKLNAQLLADIDAGEPGLPEEERQRRLGHARSEYFARLKLDALKRVEKEREQQGLGPQVADAAALRRIAALTTQKGGGGDA